MYMHTHIYLHVQNKIYMIQIDTKKTHYYFCVIDRYVQIFIIILAYTYKFIIYLYTYILT